MSQQIINISTPDDGLGDVLRNGFDKTNQNFTELYSGKVDKIAGQGLSENNFTDADKAKLDGIEAGAEVNVQADFLETDPTADSFILNKPPSLYSSVGYFHISNSLTAQSISSGVAADLLNNNLGTYSSSSQAPYGISAIWNTTTNAFDFSQLSLGDMVSLRVDLFIDTTATNQDFRVYITLGIGTASEYSLLLNQTTYKGAASSYDFLEEVTFSIDNEDWRTAPAKIIGVTDASATVLVNGWYVPIIRKSVNVIDVIGGENKVDKDTTAGVERVYTINPDGSQGTKATSEFSGTTSNLQQVTDIGNTTLNEMKIYNPGNSFMELFANGLYLENQLNGNNMSLSSYMLQFGDALYASNFLFRPRTQNTNFYFEDEGGSKSIATREWVNENNYRKWLVKDTTPTTAVTGTTSLTQIGSSILIPANTFSAYDVMILEGFGLDRLTTFGTVVFRLFQNTTNSLTGATGLSVSLMSQYNLTALARRTFEIEGGLLKCRFGTGSSSFFDFTGANLSPLSISFNPAIDNYFFTTVQLGNASDSVKRTQLLISK